MTDQEIFDAIWNDIREQRREGKIILVEDGRPMTIKVENICQQPTEGLLYDLGLTEAYLVALHKDNPLEFSKKMAVSSVLSFLHKFYIENKEKPKE